MFGEVEIGGRFEVREKSGQRLPGGKRLLTDLQNSQKLCKEQNRKGHDKQHNKDNGTNYIKTDFIFSSRNLMIYKDETLLKKQTLLIFHMTFLCTCWKPCSYTFFLFAPLLCDYFCF